MKRSVPAVAPESPAAPARPVTTCTIAQAAGVNISTVSRALRGVAGVSPTERDRIRGIARRMGYRPNPFVAAFISQIRTYRRAPMPATIALLDCWTADRPVWANFDNSLDYIGGIRKRAGALGYRVERIRLIDLEGSLDRLHRLLSTRRIYGLLVLPVPEGTDLSGLDFSRLACATIDFSLQWPALIRRASPHYYHNTTLALTTLVERGYRRIGYAVTTIASQRHDDLCLAAFLAFSARNPHLCVSPCLTKVSTRQRDLAAWLRRERPDALITTDFMLPDDLVAAGYRVPDDVAAVSLSQPPASSRQIAYVNEDYREVGAQAVDMIVDAIHRNEFGLPRKRVAHFVDGFWHEGRTVRPPPRKPRK
jgi:DNA-binding LacI/PurR family transcriptional regulator